MWHTRCVTNYIYKVVQIWPGQTVTCLHTNSPGHIWTTLYIQYTVNINFLEYAKVQSGPKFKRSWHLMWTKLAQSAGKISHMTRHKYSCNVPSVDTSITHLDSLALRGIRVLGICGICFPCWRSKLYKLQYTHCLSILQADTEHGRPENPFQRLKYEKKRRPKHALFISLFFHLPPSLVYF
jgi:hypothetical protein